MNDVSSEAELVSQAKAGHLAAFEQLVSRHERHIYSLALRILRHPQDAEDATQQTFLSAVENLSGLREDASFSTWLKQIATHAALKILRKRRGLDFVSLEENTEQQDGMDTIPHPDYIADWRESPREMVRRNETLRMIDTAMEQLEEKHRLVFVLRDIEGLSIQETAEALGISEGNVKVRLLRARLQLREILTQSFGDPATRIERVPHDHNAQTTRSNQS